MQEVVATPEHASSALGVTVSAIPVAPQAALVAVEPAPTDTPAKAGGSSMLTIIVVIAIVVALIVIAVIAYCFTRPAAKPGKTPSENTPLTKGP